MREAEFDRAVGTARRFVKQRGVPDFRAQFGGPGLARAAAGLRVCGEQAPVARLARRLRVECLEREGFGRRLCGPAAVALAAAFEAEAALLVDETGGIESGLAGAGGEPGRRLQPPGHDARSAGVDPVE